MPLYMAAGRELVSQRRFSEISEDGSRSLRSSDGFRDATGFTPIGLNKPLTIRIAHLYTGRYPGQNRRNDLLVTSAIKAYSVFNAAPRAVNFLTQDTPRRYSMTAPAAVDKGTSLIFYTPAVTDASLTLTLEMGFDRFPSELINEIGAGFQAIGQLPVFLPWSGFILAGSQLVRLLSGIGERLFESQPEFARTETLDFALPGFDRPEAAFRVLTGPDFDVSGLAFSPRRGLVSKADENKTYDGDEPYIVISLDGARDSRLEEFTPTIASAELLSRFFGSERKSSAAIDAIVEAARIANDMKFRREADRLAREAKVLKENSGDDAEIAGLLARRDAVILNITSDELKPVAGVVSGTTRGSEGTRHTSRNKVDRDEPVVEDPDHDSDADAPFEAAAGVEKRESSGAMRDWRIAASLLALRHKIDALFPERDRSCDGTIGDAAHANRRSDHNPHIIDDGKGVVTAIDITHDPSSGCDAGEIVSALIRSRDARIKYIIYNREIISSYPSGGASAWAPRAYTGANPHKKHFHLSVVSSKSGYDDESEWQVS